MADRLAIGARNVDKHFGAISALSGFTLAVPKGQFVTLLGPSGCGKTTALRLIAGFERPERGEVEVAGRVVAAPRLHVPPDQRRVGMVFQDYALFPHLSVAANVGYGLSRHGTVRVKELLEMVGLIGLEDRLPYELSGGQQQRVALARALAPQPEVILLDEPFSNLDAALRSRVRREVKSILSEARTTALFVTHDQEEALAISDRVAVMKDGRVLQADSPPDLYRNPVDPWVAGFLGDADFIAGHASRGRVDTPLGVFATQLSGPVQVMVRPENVSLVSDPDGDGVVREAEFFGHDQLVTVVMTGGVQVRSRVSPGAHLLPGTRVWVKAEGPVIYPV